MAIQALPLEERETYFLNLWESISSRPWDEPTFLEIVNALGNPAIYKVVEPSFHDSGNASHLASLAADTRDKVAYPDLGKLLDPAVAFLLDSPYQAEQEIGLEAAEAYNLPDLEADMIRLLEAPESNATVVNLAIGALSKNPSPKTRTVFGKLFQDEKLSFELRLASLNALLRGKGQSDSHSLSLLQRHWTMLKNGSLSTLYPLRSGEPNLVGFAGLRSIDGSGFRYLDPGAHARNQ